MEFIDRKIDFRDFRIGPSIEPDRTRIERWHGCNQISMGPGVNKIQYVEMLMGYVPDFKKAL